MEFLKTLFITLNFLLFGSLSISHAQGDIEVMIPALEDNSGKVMLMLFNKEEGFPSDSEAAYRQEVLAADKKGLTYRFSDLPYGSYAITAAHDENGHGLVDKNFIGIPKEPTGASNHSSFGKPSFEKCLIPLSEQQSSRSVTIELMK